jgi:16S rRNA (cytosine967-C5)-methyltransferase
MRLFPNQIKALEEVLDLVGQGAVLDNELKKKVDFHKKWGAKDRRNFYQAAYDIVRYYELLEYQGKQDDKGIIGTYVSNMTEHALDYETLKQNTDIEEHIRLSLPKSLCEIYQKEDPRSSENLKDMQQPGNIYLRINTSLISMNKFAQKLTEQEIPHEVITEIKIDNRSFKLNCIRLINRTQTHRQFFQENQSYFEIQDIGSQLISEFVDFSKAMTIIEACAGNGGKTTHIIDKTREINPLHLACDSERKKLEHLRLRIDKWKDHKVVTDMAKDKVLEKYQGMADILCMDVPCTGSGTLKRQPDIKYRINQNTLDEKIQTQRELFQLFDKALKPGGQLLYSTCSLFQSENQKQIEYITQHGYELEDQLLLEPRNYEGDGFFMAKLRKKAIN